MKRIFTYLAFVIIPLLGSAQQYYTRTYTVDDGLPSNQVNCLYQDSIGRLWIGTDAGIAIFDGTEFQIITKKEGLASNDIRAITQDEHGNFWFACYDGGATKFDGKSFTTITTKDGFHSNYIRRLYFSKTFGMLFIGADDGFYTLTDGQLEFYGKANGKLQEEHEIVWFLEGKGFVYVMPFKDYVLKFYPETKKLVQMKEPSVDGEPLHHITSALVTSKGDTILGNRFLSREIESNRNIHLSRTGLVFNMCEDSDGNIWFPLFGSIASGLIRWDGTNLVDYTARLGLEDIKTNYVLFDSISNNLFIATEQNGLVFKPKEIFTSYSMQEFLKQEGDFRQLHYNSGKLYLVFKDMILWGTPNNFQPLPIDMVLESSSGDIIRGIINRFYEGKAIRSTPLWLLPEFFLLANDQNQNLWASTTVGFLRFSEDHTKFTKAFMPSIRYGAISFDHNNQLFCSSYWIDSLYVINDPNLADTLTLQKFHSKNSVLPKAISKMLPTSSGMLLSSIYGGLYLYDDSNLIHLNKTAPELPDNVSYICQDRDGNIVFCTNTGEIGIGAISNNAFTLKHRLDSLDHSYGRNFIWMICDPQNQLYVGTNTGMLLVNLPELYSTGKKDIRYFSSAEGYTDYSVASPVLDKDGNVWLASQQTLLKTDSKAIVRKNDAEPTILLSKLETSDSVYQFDNPLQPLADAGSHWKFPHASNNLTFHFTSINLLNPEKDHFSVQLKGFDESFKDVGTEHKAVYTNLPSGNYKFNVRVRNLNTQKEQTQTLLTFRIKPPYWQTWWFMSIIILILLSSTGMLYYWRIQSIRKSARINLEIAELEMKALQAQMNPHFVFNVLNSLQRYIMERDTSKGIKLLSDFSAMIRQTFTLASKKVITLEEEMAYLDSYLKLEQVRFGNKFQYAITNNTGAHPFEVHIPSMLLQPLVENAIKHGISPLPNNDGQLFVTFTDLNEHSLKCTIEDNGIGIEKSLAAKRDNSTRLEQAMSITQRRIELFTLSDKKAQYAVTVTDRSHIDPSLSGTIVEIILPIVGD